MSVLMDITRLYLVRGNHCDQCVTSLWYIKDKATYSLLLVEIFHLWMPFVHHVHLKVKISIDAGIVLTDVTTVSSLWVL